MLEAPPGVNPRKALGGLVVAVLAAACSSGRAPAPSAPASPVNVLVITLDQVGTGLGTYGSPARSPHLDRLAARGRRFDRAYSQYPALTPSRLALLLGRRPETTRLWSVPESRESLGGALPMPEAFHARAYFTARVGSLLGPSADAVVAWDLAEDFPEVEPGATARRAVELLSEHKDGPFFLAVGFGGPPRGALPPAEYLGLYDPRALVLPVEPSDVGLPPLALADFGAAPVPRPSPLPEPLRRRLFAAELAHVSHLDAQVGVLLAELDRLGLRDRTAVVVVGDAAPSGPWPRPDVLFEETLRSALIVAAPGIASPGRASDRLVELVDVFPTLLDLAGLPRVDGLDGVSLRPLLDDPGRSVKAAAVSAAQRFADTLGRSVRTDRWRYTEWPDGSRELYDQAQDAGELRNLARSGASAETTMRELRAALESAAEPVRPAASQGESVAQAPAPKSGNLTSKPRTPAAKPNVLLIMVDDLNVRLGCYGYPVRSPSVDRLAREGRRFDRAYCQIASCSPSRTSLLTGWRPERTGVWDNLQPPRERLQGAVPLQEHFHANGYFTARVGKIYHGPFEEQFQWDVAEHTPYLPGDEAWEPPPKKERESAGSAARPWTATDNRDEDEPDGRTARRVVELITRNQGRPFFIAAGFNKPHIHWIAPRRYFDLYPPDRIELPAEPPDDRDDIPEIAIFRKAPRAPGRFLGGTAEGDDAFRREATAAYYACVSFMDAQVGILLETLDRLKLRDRTIVVLLGDHGFHLGEHGLWRKNTLFEESLRVPFILAAPGLEQPGVAAGGLVESLDLYPTLVDLAGLPTVPGLDGASLRPLLDDPQQTIRAAAFSIAPRNPPELGRSVRSERWRYTEWPDGGQELQDLAPPGWLAHIAVALGARDDGPPPNLAGDPRFASIVTEMKALLDRAGR